MILLSVVVGLSIAALLIGFLGGPAILSTLGFSNQARGMPSPSSALFACAGALLCETVGLFIGFMGLSNASMRSTTVGTILRSTIRSFPCDEGHEHYIFSTVAYDIDGVQYEGEGSHHNSSNSEVTIRERLAGVRRGDSVVVYYKAGDPEVIDLDAPPVDTWGSLLFGGALILVGALLLFFAGSTFAS